MSLHQLLLLSAVLFVIGIAGFITRRNIIIMFMSVELMLNAANLALISFAYHSGSMDAQLIALFVMALAAAEVAVGLAIIITVFRNKQTVNVDELNILKW
ncbi:MAG: NADH-quinone oxidoreductase subunit K [Candidatus Glassbacteria bacterium GWA2_58_10]|uniref:NADH-quinone oxidoreductase subunit K n=1 Tax=Candidatus Glassbacteria bacterium GWA2_58_10 TaxID=1817865 RepID=A0A1F5YF58_9BACT|nr:MAG: NADH-quinone oxidoreductase subunit K [Candidatus Glassbacteria bacterium GWA2_58_10]